MSKPRIPRKRISKYHSVIKMLAELYDRPEEDVKRLYNHMDHSISDTRAILSLTSK